MQSVGSMQDATRKQTNAPEHTVCIWREADLVNKAVSYIPRQSLFCMVSSSLDSDSRVTSPKGAKTNIFSNIWPLARPNIA